MSRLFIKGHSLRQNLESVRSLFGDAILERVVQGLPREYQAGYRAGTLLASGWYPLEWHNELLKQAQLILPQVRDVPERIGRYGTEQDMRGIYGFLARLITPELALRQAPRALSTFFKGLIVSSHLIEPGRGEIRFSNSRDVSRNLWRQIAASAEFLLLRAGGKNALLRYVSGGRDGDEVSVLEARWQ